MKHQHPLVFASGSQALQRGANYLRQIQANGGAPKGASAAIAEMQEDLGEALQAFVGFKRKTVEDMQSIKAAIDDFASRSAAAQLGVGQRPAEDPVYSNNFNAFLRNGEREAEIRAAQRTGRYAEIHASMNIGSAGDGGYLAPTEWDRTIIGALTPLSPMRRLATVVQSGVNAYSTLWNAGGWGSGWVGETATRPETTTNVFQPLTFGHGEVYANAAATQRLLDDAQIDVAGFIADEISDTFAKQENIAFIAGNGTNKPFGFLTYATGAANASVHPGGAIQVTTVASATAITADELMRFLYALAAPYRQNATWLMASSTALLISLLKDSGGAYIWREGLAAGQPATLLGRPVEIDENMPTATAGALAIALGDFKQGYVINDRTGLRVLRDPYTNKPYVMFYCTKRVGGGLRDPNAIRVMKMAAS
jgi:HK97 family phage major capsid protein